MRPVSLPACPPLCSASHNPYTLSCARSLLLHVCFAAAIIIRSVVAGEGTESYIDDLIVAAIYFVLGQVVLLGFVLLLQVWLTCWERVDDVRRWAQLSSHAQNVMHCSCSRRCLSSIAKQSAAKATLQLVSSWPRC